MIGFEKIIIFQNDSDDGTDAILKALRNVGIVKYLYNRAVPGRHQVKAYIRSQRQEEYQSADWVIALDLDEFLVIRTGDGKLQDFIDKVPRFDCAFICWKLFGSAGGTTVSDDRVTDRFTLAERDEWISTNLGAFKSLFRRDVFARPGIHRPPGLEPDSGKHRIINGSGYLYPEFGLKNFRCTDPGQRALAQINHYIVKDAMSFVLKNHKGSAHQTHRKIDETYWRQRNKNEAQDLRIQAYSAELSREMEKIDAETGGRISALTAASRDHHHARFDELMQDPKARALYAFCKENVTFDDPVRDMAIKDQDRSY